MIHILMQIFASTLASAACPRVCLIGGPPQCTLASEISSTNGRDQEFLINFYKANPKLSCQPPDKLSETAKAILQSTEQSISVECIQTSVSMIPDIQKTDRAVCANDSAVPLRRSSRQEPCLPEVYDDYVAWATGRAMKCIGAIAQRPIASEVVFKKLHNESRFGFHLSSSRGKGIGQLVTIGVSDVYRDTGNNDLIDKAILAPECDDFHKIMTTPLKLASDGSARICQLVSPGNGLGRNLLSSFILFATHRDQYGVNTLAEKNGITDPKKIDYLTLITFGREGFPQMRAAIRQLRAKHSPKELNTMSLDSFVKELANYSDYIKETEASAKMFAAKQNPGSSDYNAEVKKCISGY